MSYNNGPGPLVLTTKNDPSLWRTNSYYQRLQAKRNAARTRKNRPGITNTIKMWFGAQPATSKRRRRSRRANIPRIMYE
jgi:hypothetical protein